MTKRRQRRDRCKATTEAGKRCSRRTKAGERVCAQHAATSQIAQYKKEAKPRAGTEAARRAETAAKKRTFLDAYARTATVTSAALAAHVARRTHYDWLEVDPDYVTAFADAKAEAIDRLEQEARRRAVAGSQEPVYYQGKKVGTNRRYSDSLLMFLLKGAKPETYRERPVQVGVGVQGSRVEIILPANSRRRQVTG